MDLLGAYESSNSGGEDNDQPLATNVSNGVVAVSLDSASTVPGHTAGGSLHTYPLAAPTAPTAPTVVPTAHAASTAATSADTVSNNLKAPSVPAVTQVGGPLTTSPLAAATITTVVPTTHAASTAATSAGTVSNLLKAPPVPAVTQTQAGEPINVTDDTSTSPPGSGAVENKNDDIVAAVAAAVGIMNAPPVCPTRNYDSKEETTTETKEEEFVARRVAKKFIVRSTNKMHQTTNVATGGSCEGTLKKIFFGSVTKFIEPSNVWKIIFDDGDVDILSHDDVSMAIQLYDQYKKYDLKLNTVPKFVDNGGDGGWSTAASGRKKQRGKKAISRNKHAKPPRAEPPQPVWVGPPDESLDGGWPVGWIKKVYARKTGSHKDRYWYTPKENIKLRSMVQVKLFLQHLKSTNGNENEAKAMLLKK